MRGASGFLSAGIAAAGLCLSGCLQGLAYEARDDAGGASVSGERAGDAAQGATSDAAGPGGFDASADATGSPSPIAPLNWCSMLLVDFGFPGDAATSTPSVASTIVLDVANPSSFIPALNGDCRFGG